MDNEAAAMRQEMDETMAGLTDKLGELGHQVSGTMRTVKDSVNTVRDSFDLKLQVRRRPWTVLAGATALGFLCGFRPNSCGAGHPTRNGRSDSAPRDREFAAEHPHTGVNGGANGADAARFSAQAAPCWLASLGNTFQPEIAALRGAAVGVLLEVIRERIAKPEPRTMPRPAGDANSGAGKK